MAKRIKAVLVGLHFGQQVARHMLLSGTGKEYINFAGVCDLDSELAQKCAQEYGVRHYTSLDDVLADASIEAVILICGPNGRAKLLSKIINAGKDVMTTKPFEISATEAANVLSQARKLGRIIHLNSPAPARTKDFQVIADWVQKYSLGRPVAGRHECWYKSVEEADGSWYDDPQKCPVAPIFRLGIYGINEMVKIFGAPQAVQVMESRIFTGRPTPDLAQLTIKFVDGSIVSTLDGWCLQPERTAQSLIVFYENGIIIKNPLGTVASTGSSGATMMVIPAANADGLPAETVKIGHEECSSAYQWSYFAECVRGQQMTPIEYDSHVVNSIKIIEIMKRAMNSGRTESA